MSNKDKETTLITLVWRVWQCWDGVGFFNRKSCKTFENTVKSPESMSSFTLSKAVHWARLESLHFSLDSPQ